MKNGEKNTLGFGVNNAPIWLCKELEKEAKLYYAGAYWPVLIDWYRKAKEFEKVTQKPDEPVLPDEIEVEEKNPKDSIATFGK